MKKTIWGNTIVKNEGRFIWFALMSVIDFLDKILVWDTGSTDSTVAIIKEVSKRKKGKIKFSEIGKVNEENFTLARQKMLDQSNCDWLFVVDGDEVWWESSIRRVVETIQNKGDNLDLIVSPFYNLVGDIYHYQEKAAGKYNLAGRRGHLNIRAINRNIPGLHVSGPYGKEGYFDEDERKIQERDPKRIIYVNTPYLHFSNISRSDSLYGDSQVMQRRKKIRHEIGIKFPKGFKYPEALYRSVPSFVPSPWFESSRGFKLKASLETPFRKLKRRLT